MTRGEKGLFVGITVNWLSSPSLKITNIKGVFSGTTFKNSFNSYSGRGFKFITFDFELDIKDNFTSSSLLFTNIRLVVVL